MVGLSNEEKNSEGMCNRLDGIPACGRTDGRTDIFPRHNPRCVYASRGENRANNVAFCRAVLAVMVMWCMSVCLSVRSSRSWIVSKRIKVSSVFFHHVVAKPF